MLVERGDRRHYAFAAAAGAERIDEFRTFGLLLFFSHFVCLILVFLMLSLLSIPHCIAVEGL